MSASNPEKAYGPLEDQQLRSAWIILDIQDPEVFSAVGAYLEEAEKLATKGKEAQPQALYPEIAAFEVKLINMLVEHGGKLNVFNAMSDLIADKTEHRPEKLACFFIACGFLKDNIGVEIHPLPDLESDATDVREPTHTRKTGTSPSERFKAREKITPKPIHESMREKLQTSAPKPKTQAVTGLNSEDFEPDQPATQTAGPNRIVEFSKALVRGLYEENVSDQVKSKLTEIRTSAQNIKGRYTPLVSEALGTTKEAIKEVTSEPESTILRVAKTAMFSAASSTKELRNAARADAGRLYEDKHTQRLAVAAKVFGIVALGVAVKRAVKKSRK